jgi:hypothetical protein
MFSPCLVPTPVPTPLILIRPPYPFRRQIPDYRRIRRQRPRLSTNGTRVVS